MHLPGVEVAYDFSEMRDLTHSIVVIDEAAEWFSAHSSKDNQKFMRFFRQHGKEGNTLYLIAHSYADLDVSIRERTCEGIWRVRRMFGPTRWEEPSPIEKTIGWWAIATCHSARDYDAVTKRTKKAATRFFRLDELHGLFDTLCKVGKMGEGHIGSGAGLAAGVAQAAGGLRHRLTRRQYMAAATVEGFGSVVRWRPPVDDALDNLRLVRVADDVTGRRQDDAA
jgi:hypothetical protein